MTNEPATTPEQVFQTCRVLFLAFVAAVFVYIAVGEIIRLTDPEFVERGGYVGFGDEIWIIRGALILVAATQLISVHSLFGERFVRKAVSGSDEITDIAVSGALQTAFIQRLAFTESVAIYGLVLYLMNGERIDLYGFCFAALVNFLLIRPQRTEWEETFRWAAIEHSGVRSSPW